MPRFEFRDKYFTFVTYTPNLEIALLKAKGAGFTEDKLVEPPTILGEQTCQSLNQQ